LGRKISRTDLIKQFFLEFEILYSSYLVNGFKGIKRDWKMKTNTLGHRVKIIDGQEEIYGKAVDIDDNGFLVLETESGKSLTITAGDVSLRKV
jgi:BirA family biotin operon repressor/biotin-[acetyl-CoA-carboxylase] ligase